MCRSKDNWEQACPAKFRPQRDRNSKLKDIPYRLGSVCSQLSLSLGNKGTILQPRPDCR